MEYNGGDLLKKEVNIEQFNFKEVIRILSEIVQKEIISKNTIEDGEKKIIR